jgi:hypothetical protein
MGSASAAPSPLRGICWHVAAPFPAVRLARNALRLLLIR